MSDDEATLLDFRDEVVTADGLLLKGTRLILPRAVRSDLLRQIHKNHLGINKCRQRARYVLFWPGMSVHIEEMVTNVECVHIMRTHSLQSL